MPSVVQGTSCSVGASDCTLTLTGVTAGRAVGIVAASYGNTIATPSGFTLAFSRTNGSDANAHLYGFIRENASGTVSADLGTASGGISGWMGEFRDVPTTSVLDGTASGTDDSTSTFDTPSITIAADSCLFGGLTHISATTTLTPTYTQKFEQEDNATHMAINVCTRGEGTGLTAGSYILSWTAGAGIAASTGVMALKHLAEGGGGGFTPKSRRTLEFMSRVGRRSSGP